MGTMAIGSPRAGAIAGRKASEYERLLATGGLYHFLCCVCARTPVPVVAFPEDTGRRGKLLKKGWRSAF